MKAASVPAFSPADDFSFSAPKQSAVLIRATPNVITKFFVFIALAERISPSGWMQKLRATTNVQTRRVEKANRRRSCLRLIFAMEKQKFADLPAEEQRYFYRCPACGEMVDNRNLNEIVLHHAHVLHPNRFVFSRAPAAKELAP
jgi:hypothetical protein